MKNAITLMSGIGIGAVGAHELHAQAKPPVFMIEDNAVRDPDGFAKEFAPLARKSLKTYGGRYLAGGAGISIDDDPPKGRVLIVQWDTLDQLRRWRQSPEYARARAIGENYGSFRVIAVEGALR